MLFQPPFPSNGNAEADAIIGIGYMSAIFLIFLIFLYLMLYARKHLKDNIAVMITIYISSLSMAIGSMGSPYFPFTPSFQVFIILIQTSLFIESAIDFNKTYKIKKRGY